MSSLNLPLRYSIETDGTAPSHLDHICSTVISEGGVEKTDILRSVDVGSTPLTASSSGTLYAMIGIRLKADYKDITVIPEALTAIATSNDSFRWSLHFNPTITNPFAYSDVDDSSLQEAYGVTANVITDEGTKIASGYSSTSTKQIDTVLNTALRLGSTIAGVQDELILAIMPLSTNLTVYGSLEVRELL